MQTTTDPDFLSLNLEFSFKQYRTLNIQYADLISGVAVSAALCWTVYVLVQLTFRPWVDCVCRSRLFSHVDDPFLDDPLPREYVLYLRPNGPLLQQLSHFWQQSRISCGKNKAHNIFPHVTLCQFFMVSVDCLKTWQHHTSDFEVFQNFSTFYRSSIDEASHICIHVTCQSSTCWPSGECAGAVISDRKKVYLQYI